MTVKQWKTLETDMDTDTPEPANKKIQQIPFDLDQLVFWRLLGGQHALFFERDTAKISLIFSTMTEVQSNAWQYDQARGVLNNNSRRTQSLCCDFEDIVYICSDTQWRWRNDR